MLLPTGKIGLMAPGTEFLLALRELSPFASKPNFSFFSGPVLSSFALDIHHVDPKLKRSIPIVHNMLAATDRMSAISQ